VNFKLPKKELLYIELRKGRGKVQVEGEYKDLIYQALSEKNIVRARTLFSTEKANYQVLSYEKHGQSANISIMRLREKI